MSTIEYNVISESSLNTVVAEYPRIRSRETNYQSEKDLEEAFINQLVKQGYEYVNIRNEKDLIDNLRVQIEKLNDYKFTDAEWERFYSGEIASSTKGIEEKTNTIQKDYIKTLVCDDHQQRNICLINKSNIYANSTQVINQYVPNGGTHKNRYDVTILVNGLPLVHIELKRRGVDIKEAFNQINRYGKESFWSDNGLFEYVQIFVISNGTLTRYYSNTIRFKHVQEQGGKKVKHKLMTNNTYEFTNYWADATNKVITDITDFTATFFSRHTMLNVLTRYCVFTSQKQLLAMRPYQIVATERILNKIEKAHYNHLCGTRNGGGYIWHTTGSGKTLTSFKTAQLATQLPYIHKVLFVVDRKDLDYQTMVEYDSFEPGAANGNTSTAVLAKQLEDNNSRIIITTIQKLSIFANRNATNDIYNKEVVIIFDECHRSQFGEMHKIISKKFKKYYLFGFTGTPIFAENCSSKTSLFRTTDDVFCERLHSYTIVDAIRDANVLPFHISYVRTMKNKDDIETFGVWDIDRESVMKSKERIANVTKYILDHFDQQTKRTAKYAFRQVRNVADVVAARNHNVEEMRANVHLEGFNSILATYDIETAKLYYNEFKQQMDQLPINKRKKVAIIFSFALNENVDVDIDFWEEEENPDSTEYLDRGSRAFLEEAIKDYNEMFSTNYDTSSEKFSNYYKDVSLRTKNREIDLLIVVNMFLTGFDATTLNTLWVDKNLRYHSLMQAFSRTNRILNSKKVVGNIVCFVNLEEETNRALSLFGDSEAHSTTIIRPFLDYFDGYTDKNGKHICGYAEYLKELFEKFPLGETFDTEKAEKEFIHLFGCVLRMNNLLSNFEEFEANNPLTERDLQDYTSIYLTLADKYRREENDRENIHDDIVFEMELVKELNVTIDYILYLVGLYHESHCRDAEIRTQEILAQIKRSIDSSTSLRDKKELIMEFINKLTPESNIDNDWKEYVNEMKCKELIQIIEENHLKPDKTILFVERAFERGYVPEVGMELNKILLPMNPFDRAADRVGKMQIALDKLKIFFNKFFTIADNSFEGMKEYYSMSK